MGEPTEEEIRVCAKALLVAVGDVGANTANQILSATEHSGDCTKQPWTCNVCYADEHRQMARVAITALRAMDREKELSVARTDELGVWHMGNDSPTGT